MPSLARVMPVISLFIACFLPLVIWTRFSLRETISTSPENALVGSVARCAILGVTVAVIFENLLYDLGLEFAVGALGDLGQIEVLNRIAIDVEFETAAQRGEISLLQ